MQQLDHHSTRLMTIFKRKGGAAGRKIRNIMVDLDKNEAVETRRACVLKALMVYFNEDPENLIREYMWKAGVDPCPTSPCRRRTVTFFSVCRSGYYLWMVLHPSRQNYMVIGDWIDNK
ncbi:hypothetical protein JOB18_020225, partial [Solea senegalensis]